MRAILTTAQQPVRGRACPTNAPRRGYQQTGNGYFHMFPMRLGAQQGDENSQGIDLTTEARRAQRSPGANLGSLCVPPKGMLRYLRLCGESTAVFRLVFMYCVHHKG